jgi:hypothetical protein
LGLIFSKKLKKSCLKNPVFVSKTAQLGVPFSLPPYLLPVVFDYFLLKKLRKLSFLLGLMGVYLLFFHKYLSPYLSPKKIKTCKSNRCTGLCGAEGSEVELFWRGFSYYNKKLSSRIKSYFQE